MRFFITGQVNSKKGPRQILIFCLIFLLLFILSHFIREMLHLGMTTASILHSTYESMQMGLISISIILEELHMLFFFFGLAIIFIGSIWYQLPIALRYKNAFFISLILSFLIYSVMKFCLYFVPAFSAIFLAMSIFVHFYLCIAILLSAIFLFKK